MNENSVKNSIDRILLEKKIDIAEIEKNFNIPAKKLILVKENKYTEFYEFEFDSNTEFKKIEARKEKKSGSIALLTIYVSPEKCITLNDVIDTEKNKEINLTVIPNAGIRQISYLIGGIKVTYGTSIEKQYLVNVTLNYEP